MSFALLIPGPPHGKDRPRARVVAPKGKKPFVSLYTPEATTTAEKAWQHAWREAGSPTVEGPFSVAIEVYVARPKDHFTSKGELSAKGRRNPLPHGQKPDMDNVLKLVLDALNGHAYKDDVAATDIGHSQRRWAVDEGVRVWIAEVDEGN